MSLKGTKILIPEIPPEWTQRTRSGDTNVWNDNFFRNGLSEIKLDPPIRGLYAERFDDGWYWVCGCHKCLENGKPYSYIVCNEHDKCVTCNTHRTELTEIPWGRPDGFQCNQCAAREHEEDKREAIEKAQEQGHSEDDCQYTDEVICPVCASENGGAEIQEDNDHKTTC